MTTIREPKSLGRGSWIRTWLGDIAHMKCGLAIFSGSGELLHINRQAACWLRLGRRVGRDIANDQHGQGTASPVVTCLRDDLLHIVSARTEAADWRRIEITSLIHVGSRRLLLRGFGIPDRKGMTEARIVMTIEEAPFAEGPLSAPWVTAGDRALIGASRCYEGGQA